jgi:hypothetical protein
MDFYKELVRFPENIYKKIIKHNNEYGCRQDDFIEILNFAKNVPMACIGGQVQYIFENATCELYWINYVSNKREENEKWVDYCNRSNNECIKIFEDIIKTINFNEEAANFNPYLKEKIEKGYDIEKNKIFILYFDDNETDKELLINNLIICMGK